MTDISEVIAYEGDNSTFIWKHPIENFEYSSQLIVHENQEAIFFKNGQALDLFGPGRYTLETDNIPIINKFFNRVTGDKSPFHCEVYFINKVEHMAIKWGTNSKIQYTEPTYGFPISVGASGEMSIKVTDSRNLLVNLVGTEKSFTVSTLTDYFRSLLMTKTKAFMAQVIVEKKISIFDLDSRLDEFSEDIKKLLIPIFENYGVGLEQFYVTTLLKPDGERQYEKFKELHFRQYADITEAKIQQQTAIIHAETEAQRTVIESRALATKRLQEGYTYQQERGFDVAEIVGKNEATGQFTNMGIGLGTMASVGNAMSGIVGSSIDSAMLGVASMSPNNPQSNIFNANSLTCAKCGASLTANAKFCLECGEKVSDTKNSTCFCPNCGKQVPKGKFCPECGHQINSVKVCSKCGKEVAANSKFCLECGNKLL